MMDNSGLFLHWKLMVLHSGDPNICYTLNNVVARHSVYLHHQEVYARDPAQAGSRYTITMAVVFYSETH